MTTGQLIVVDHVVALLGAAAWLAAGATAAARRTRIAHGLFAVAGLMTLARIVTVVVLAGRGWWFVQEKVVLNLPMLGAAALAAAVFAGQRVLLLFTAGYAALAGLVVTLVAGYPLTWSTALIAVAAVGTGALLTVRVGSATKATSGLSRRRFLGLVVGTGTTGIGLLFVPAKSGANASHHGRSVADLRGADSPAPGGARRQYTLTARTAGGGRWTYNGQTPGPQITATEGDLVEVTLRNSDIDGGVTLHWHGYDVACGEDGAPGVTQNAVLPGEEFHYRFRADQVGTYWYHTHHASHIGVRRGLFGTLVVTPRGQQLEQLDLTLPVHTFDGTVVVANREKLNAAAGTTVRLRLVNTDSAPHRFALDGTPFRVVAVDGRDLNGPGEVSEVALRLPAGGRRDLVFTMPDRPVALALDNEREDRPELDLLHYGTPAAVPFEANRHFTLVLDRGVAMVDGKPAYAQTVNGRGHPSIPDQVVAEGDRVRFTVVNRSLETHPWHLHGHAVLVLSRNGTRPTGSPLWMDTFDVRPGEVWEVGFRATNPGIWMNHCHNLPHAQQGMMLMLRYDGIGPKL